VAGAGVLAASYQPPCGVPPKGSSGEPKVESNPLFRLRKICRTGNRKDRPLGGLNRFVRGFQSLELESKSETK
jgi:hypothetical protein